MSKLFWLASYPKSGNTWLRTLLTNYLRDEDEPADINNLMSAGAFDTETMDEYLGIESSELNEEQIFLYRPLVYQAMAEDNTEPLFLKVHDAYLKNSQHLPIFPEKATGGVFYLIRNPLEVAVSYAHHRNTSLDKTIASMNDDKHILGGWKGNSGQLPQKLLSWSNHVRSWINQPARPIHIIRYEDMLADAITEFSKVVRFAGLEYDEERIARAVEFSSFENLRKQEQKNGFAEKQPSAKSFFRKGKADSWRESLSREQTERIISDHREMMKKFGYLDCPDKDLLE
jgi:hypothetical protein